MKVFYIRHQAAGTVYTDPFGDTPTAAECAAVLARCEDRYGKTAPKTGKPFWAKIVCLENGVETVIACAHGSADVDARASGECPIREAGYKRWPEADEADRIIEALDVRTLKVRVNATGHVKNP